MYNRFIVNENRKQKEVGEAEAIRLLADPETEINEAYLRRGDGEIHQRPIKGMTVASSRRCCQIRGQVQ